MASLTIGFEKGGHPSRGLTLDAKQPVNVFAQIDDGLDELKEIGARIIRHGAERVRFSLAQEE